MGTPLAIQNHVSRQALNLKHRIIEFHDEQSENVYGALPTGKDNNVTDSLVFLNTHIM